MKELVYYFHPRHRTHNVNLDCMDKFMIETQEQFMKDYGLTSLDEVFEKHQLEPGIRVYKTEREALNWALYKWGFWGYDVVRNTILMYKKNGGTSE